MSEPVPAPQPDAATLDTVDAIAFGRELLAQIRDDGTMGLATGAIFPVDELPPGVPVIPNIDAAILAAIEKDQSGFNMSGWGFWDGHRCGTTLCRGGWAVHLAGDAGYALAARYPGDNEVPAALIYAASRPGQPIPSFFTDNRSALADIRACAAAQLAASGDAA